MKWRCLYSAAGLVFIMALTSCLDMEAELLMKKSGEVDVRLEYLFDSDGARFGRGFGADEPWPLPLTEKDFRLQTLRHEGVHLKRYRSRRLSDGSESITVRLQARSIQAVMDFFDWEIKTDGNAASGSLEIVLPAVNPQLKDETREILESVIDGSDFVLRVKTPRKPKTVEGGEKEKASGIFRLSLGDLVFSPEPVTWAITW